MPQPKSPPSTPTSLVLPSPREVALERVNRQLALHEARVPGPQPRDVPFPQVIDNTMLSDFKACPLRAYWTHFRGIVPESAHSPDLVAGGAFARGIEVTRHHIWGLGEPLDEALASGLRAAWSDYGTYEPPPNHVKTPLNVGLALVDYFRTYPPATDHIQPHMRVDGSPAVEFTGCYPLPGSRHPETGDPLLYAARWDMIGEYRRGRWGVDEKTTKQLGRTWSQKWGLRGQFIGYNWVYQQATGEPLQGFIVRGIAFYANQPPAFAEAVIYHGDWLIERWLMSVQLTVDRMIDCWESGIWPGDFGDACTSYSGCPYQPLCEARDAGPWLADYTVRVWDPLARNPSMTPEEASA